MYLYMFTGVPVDDIVVELGKKQLVPREKISILQELELAVEYV